MSLTSWMGALAQDAKFALRLMSKERGFTLLAVVALVSALA